MKLSKKTASGENLPKNSATGSGKDERREW
jgi:hypothetical protein